MHTVLLSAIAGFCFIAFITIIALGMSHESDVERDKMKSCVAAGKTWVRDGGTAYYECK